MQTPICHAAQPALVSRPSLPTRPRPPRPAPARPQVKVIRGGQQLTVPNYEVVVGDLMLLDTGDKIIADGYVAEVRGQGAGRAGAGRGRRLPPPGRQAAGWGSHPPTAGGPAAPAGGASGRARAACAPPPTPALRPPCSVLRPAPQTHGLIVDEASLTGESDPVKKGPVEAGQEPWVRSGTQVRSLSRPS